jgi:hypothetical protein
MATINNNWVSDYYKKRPQLKRPHFGMFGYDIPPEWKPVVEKLLDLVGSAPKPIVEADAKQTGACSKCGMPREIHRCYNTDKSTA